MGAPIWAGLDTTIDNISQEIILGVAHNLKLLIIEQF